MESNELKAYLQLLEQGIAHPSDNELFGRILKLSESELLLTDSDLAVEMQMNRSTIHRWRSGASAPLIIMRKSVFNWLKKRTSLMIRKIDEKNKNLPDKSKLSAKEL